MARNNRYVPRGAPNRRTSWNRRRSAYARRQSRKGRSKIGDYTFIGGSGFSQALTALKEFSIMGVIPVGEIVLNQNQFKMTQGMCTATRNFVATLDVYSTEPRYNVYPVLVAHALGDSGAFFESDNTVTLGGDKMIAISEALDANFNERISFRVLPALKKTILAANFVTWKKSFNFTSLIQKHERRIRQRLDTADNDYLNKFAVYLVVDNNAAMVAPLTGQYSARWDYDLDKFVSNTIF